MERLQILEHMRGHDRLLSLPQVLTEVLQEVQKEDFTSDSLAKIILKDPSLTSRILRMANSSYYQRMSEIKTVNQAVSILGVTTVKCLALSSAVFNPDKIVAESGVDPQACFAYVLSVAAASERIAREVDGTASDEAFIAGLLHDIGVLFFLHHYPEEYSKITGMNIVADSLVEAEQQVFGIDHCEVGHHLAEIWGLPEYVSRALVYHHHVDKIDPEDDMALIVALAVHLASDRFSGYEMGLEIRLATINQISNQLGLEKSQVDEISSSLLADTVNVADYLGVDIGNIEELLVRANQEIWKSFLTIENLFKERQELSRNLLREERAKGAVEAKNEAMATLSHYLNNAIMAIFGRTQLLRMLVNKGANERILEKLPSNLDVMDRSIEKIVAVLEEMREISPIDDKKYYHMSKALNIDDRISKRMEKMAQDGSWQMKVEKAETGVG